MIGETCSSLKHHAVRATAHTFGNSQVFELAHGQPIPSALLYKVLVASGGICWYQPLRLVGDL